ncbi:MAG: hypothetical protein M1820_000720 [Bogoriella megaspora]|nr:MAG: hypothetical protein M1820_000720 [Bogoriella megaspora]
MGAFWASWVLWERMCFVLACGIILALFLGSMKLAYSHWRIRKYTRVASQQRLKVSARDERPQIIRIDDNDIPFGIRALERGVEVEGVYISRPNTPASSVHGSRPSSFHNIPVSTKEPVVNGSEIRNGAIVEQRLPPIIPPMPWLHSSDESPFASTFSFQKSPTPDHLQTPSWLSLATAPDAETLLPARNNGDGPSDGLQRPPRIFLIESSDDSLRQNAQQTSVIPEGLWLSEGAERRAGLVYGGPSEASSLKRTSDETQVTRSSVSETDINSSRLNSQALLLPKSARQPSDFSLVTGASQDQYESSLDLESMNAHRLSHAAETGQLGQRPRRISPGRSSINDASSVSSRDDATDYVSTKSRPASIASASRGKYEFASGFQFPQRIFEAHRAASQSFKSSLPKETKDDTAIPGVAATTNTEHPLQLPADRRSLPEVSTVRSTEEPVTGIHDSGPVAQSLPTTDRAAVPSFDTSTRNQTLRKVNSGFFILKPGTLGAPQPPRSPSPSSQSSEDDEKDDQKQPKKLQKKRTSAESSRKQSNEGKRQRWSLDQNTGAKLTKKRRLT